MHQVAGSIAPYLQQQTVLSIAAGLSIQALSHMLGGYDKIVRCMPNLPASKGFGASGLYAFDVSDEVRLTTQNIMQASGKVSWVEDESLSKGGTTAAALDSLYHDNVGDAFARAMQACSDRSFELGQTFSQAD